MLTKITVEELDKILKENNKFYNGMGGKKAVLREYDFSGMDLSDRDFSLADLSFSDFTDAKLNNCCFDYTNLQESLFFRSNAMNTSFRHATLTQANFSRANITSSKFDCANCQCTDFYDAICDYASFENANLQRASFESATLQHADFNYSTLIKSNFLWSKCYGAYFKEAILYGADFRSASGLPPLPSACPETGSFIGYKKSREGFIIKLKIFESSKRSSSTGRKCRCDRAKVLEIQDRSGNKLETTIAHSDFDYSFVYEVGEIVSVKNFDNDRWEECAPGIHFFITRQEAVDY